MQCCERETVHSACFPPWNIDACKHVFQVTVSRNAPQEALGTVEMQHAGATADAPKNPSCATGDSEEARVCEQLQLDAQEAVLEEWQAISAGTAAIEAT